MGLAKLTEKSVERCDGVISDSFSKLVSPEEFICVGVDFASGDAIHCPFLCFHLLPLTLDKVGVYASDRVDIIFRVTHHMMLKR